MTETISDFKYRINRHNYLNGLINKPERELEFHEYTIKHASYKDYCNYYVKALFLDNKKWIGYLEKNHIKPADQEKFKKLVSFRTFDARRKYFETKKSKLNSFLRYFIDTNNRYQTHGELYGGK